MPTGYEASYRKDFWSTHLTPITPAHRLASVSAKILLHPSRTVMAHQVLETTEYVAQDNMLSKLQEHALRLEDYI